MIIDCFPFYDELDLLEIRLNYLAPYVDKFILSEMTITHNGKQKPLYFADNKDRFREFPVIHIICEKNDDYEMEDDYLEEHWKWENYQRECLMDGLCDFDGEDIVLLSDVDEIPNIESYCQLPYGAEGALKQKLYYYYLNCYTNQPMWKGTIATKLKNIKTLNSVRNMRNRTHPLPIDTGWHFSHMGSLERIRHRINIKIEFERLKKYSEFIDKLEERRGKLLDPYGRFKEPFTIEMPSGPQYLLDNKDKYSHLLYADS